jgi:hypothetical protein
VAGRARLAHLTPAPAVAAGLQVMFAVKAQPAEGPRLLQAVAALMGREGAQCRVDVAGYTITAALAAPAGSQGGDMSVRVSVYQLQRGSFTIKATIANDTPDVPARRFAALMAAVRADIGLMWQPVAQ